MARSSALFALALSLTAGLLACEPEGHDSVRLSDVSTEQHTSLIDRQAMLADAVESTDAEEGAALNMPAAGDGYLLTGLNGDDVTEGADGLPRSYSNYFSAVAGVLAVDLTTAAVLAGPTVAIGVAADGEIEQIGWNTWQATNTVQIAGEDVSTKLTVAWVGAGYLSEMRITTAELDDQVWFTGFVTHDREQGWWDLYEDGVNPAGFVEWDVRGDGGVFAYGALVGEHAGDIVTYSHLDTVGRVQVEDASEGDMVYVEVEEDGSGEARLRELNNGEPACWGTDYRDLPCE